ncbi:hypothetical protein DT23_16265 [Thioclava indica]|uniref:Ig-like domain-containing protein n=2 Tax=Thioclava indica TaxID=1353528 RepID=A0A074JRW6_9RHOB|nr:hypothetical protein DT23_16265 [Thioclava indica]
MTISKVSQRVGAVCIAMSIALIAAPSVAQQSAVMTLNPPRIAVKTVAGKGAARFDWLASARRTKTQAPTQTAQARSLGNGSYVCSPAGFGSRSRCYKR